jgi:RNA polymerase sigma factor (sigma-70 family)
MYWQMNTDDMDLVRQYACDNSEQAFATLVSRHINLVYSVALRQTGDASMSEEITQATFVILARKAKSLGNKTILSGWLCRTARYVAANALTIQRRRQRREQEAYMQSTLNEPNADETWRQISPLLDDALAKLGRPDHDAIVLRFFENKNLAQVGTALGMSEDAAKKRVSRALQKLRHFFFKRGVESTTATIAETISANSIQAAPVALAKSITTVALAKGATASASTATLIKGALKIMAWTKAKIAIAAAAGVILATSVSVVVVKQASLIQGKTEDQWIKSIVYRGDDNQTRRWHSLGPIGVRMLVRAMKPPQAELAEAQASESRKTRMCAADLLWSLANNYGETSAVPDVIKLLRTEKDGSVRALELGYFDRPFQSMSETDKAALLPELIRSLNGDNSGERNNALVRLQDYINQKETVVPLMVNALQDPIPGVRVMAVKALIQVDPQNAAKTNFVSVLVGCVTGNPSDMPGAANDAVVMLGELHREPDIAVPVLIQALQSDDWIIRNNAASALGKFGAQAASAVPALTKARADSNSDVRRQAVSALKRINANAPARIW